MRREVVERPWFPVEDRVTSCELQAEAEEVEEGVVAARCCLIGLKDPSCPCPGAVGPGRTSAEAGRPVEGRDVRPLGRSAEAQVQAGWPGAAAAWAVEGWGEECPADQQRAAVEEEGAEGEAEEEYC